MFEYFRYIVNISQKFAKKLCNFNFQNVVKRFVIIILGWIVTITSDKHCMSVVHRTFTSAGFLISSPEVRKSQIVSTICRPLRTACSMRPGSGEATNQRVRTTFREHSSREWRLSRIAECWLVVRNNISYHFLEFGRRGQEQFSEF